MTGPNQYHIRREEVSVSSLDLLNTNVPGQITEKGIRDNASAALQYCANWASGVGCVPISNLMEDAATAEIARLQLWQWVRHGASTTDGGNRKITAEYVDKVLDEEAEKAKKTTAKNLDPKKVDIAKRYMSQQVHSPVPDDFLTSALMTQSVLSSASPPRRATKADFWTASTTWPPPPGRSCDCSHPFCLSMTSKPRMKISKPFHLSSAVVWLGEARNDTKPNQKGTREERSRRATNLLTR